MRHNRDAIAYSQELTRITVARIYKTLTALTILHHFKVDSLHLLIILYIETHLCHLIYYIVTAFTFCV